MITRNLKPWAAGLLAAGLTVLPVGAANTAYTPGDLVLYFQKEGGANTVYVSLGNTATVFRGAATGADTANKLIADVTILISKIKGGK